jgi:hypothetical protein
MITAHAPPQPLRKKPGAQSAQSWHRWPPVPAKNVPDKHGCSPTPREKQSAVEGRSASCASQPPYNASVLSFLRLHLSRHTGCSRRIHRKGRHQRAVRVQGHRRTTGSESPGGRGQGSSAVPPTFAFRGKRDLVLELANLAIAASALGKAAATHAALSGGASLARHAGARARGRATAAKLVVGAPAATKGSGH